VTQLLPPGEIGIFHQGMTDAIARLVDGASQGLGEALTHLGVPEKDAEPAAEAVRGMLTVPMAWQGMPLGETIDLARFLVDTTPSTSCVSRQEMRVLGDQSRSLC